MTVSPACARIGRLVEHKRDVVIRLARVRKDRPLVTVDAPTGGFVALCGMIVPQRRSALPFYHRFHPRQRHLRPWFTIAVG